MTIPVYGPFSPVLPRGKAKRLALNRLTRLGMRTRHEKSMAFTYMYGGTSYPGAYGKSNFASELVRMHERALREERSGKRESDVASAFIGGGCFA